MSETQSFQSREHIQPHSAVISNARIVNAGGSRKANLNNSELNPKGHEKGSCDVQVTPEIAGYWLGFANPRNGRDLRKHIEKLSRSMRNGEWELTSDHIGFDVTGMLINGHNRLRAVVKSGCTVPMAVDFGLAVTAVTKTDKGVSRTGGHTFYMLAIPNANACHAICSAIYLWDEGLPFAKLPVNEHEALGVYDRNRERIDQIVNDSRRISRQCKSVPSVVGSVWYQCALISETDATEFFERLGDGVGLAQKSPILALRSKLLNAKTKKQVLNREEQGAVIIKAWNAYRGNRQVTLFKWVSGEELPKPV